MRESGLGSILFQDMSEDAVSSRGESLADLNVGDLSKSESPRSVSEPTNETIEVLVVDDDPETARSVARALAAAGHRVATAHSGPRALEMLAAGHFDVVLSDIGMPDMDGFGLLCAIRNVDSNVPIVLLTGDPTVSTAARALEVGAFRYVTKPIDPKDLSTIVRKAARMYRMALVKQEAARILGQQNELGRDHLGLSRAFNRCLEELWVAYQPILDARTRTIYGYEALLRSREPELPHPGAVLDAAERLSRLPDLGRIVRKRAAASLETAPLERTFFVNLHVRDLLDDALVSPSAPLTQFAARIVLEVTERSSLAEVPDVEQRISALREMGYRIAVDDLGAGYAGLTSFALLEPDFVKLDMSLVRNIHKSATKAKVVRSMINLAQDMGMMVVGEGVECEQERDALVDLGCDLLQGFHHGRPAEPFAEACW